MTVRVTAAGLQLLRSSGGARVTAAGLQLLRSSGGARVTAAGLQILYTADSAANVDSDVDLRWRLGTDTREADLELRWKIGGYLEAGTNLQWGLGVGNTGALMGNYGATYLEGNPAPTFDGERSNGLSGTPFASVEEGSPSTSARTSLGNVLLPQVAGGLCLHFAGDYYYRIWVIPDSLTLQNPQLGVPIPFEIWNAYPWDNDLTAIGGSGQEGLTLDLAAPSTFTEIELREVNITIGADAPIQIDAEFLFTFVDGTGVLYFTASIADFVQMVPDAPIVETWTWLTDILMADGASEQRVALRAAPRRTTTYSFLLANDLDRRQQARRWYKSLSSRIVLPYYQYATQLTLRSVIGATKVFFDPSKTDVRDGDFTIILDQRTETGHLIKLGTIVADGAQLDNPLTVDLEAGWILAPAFTSRLADGSGPRMKSVHGEITVEAEALDVRPLFSRPGSTAVINTFDGLNVLDWRPLAEAEVLDNHTINYDIIDSQTGLLDIKTSWPHPFVGGPRQYLLKRMQRPEDLDWWRDFLYACRGRQEPFLTPTWRNDLLMAEAPGMGASQLLINDSEYATLYFPYDTYTRLQIETAAGIIWRKVLQATANSDGTTLLELDQGFGIGADDVDIKRISFLNRVRLDNDRVKLTHGPWTTILEVSIRTVDA